MIFCHRPPRRRPLSTVLARTFATILATGDPVSVSLVCDTSLSISFLARLQFGTLLTKHIMSREQHERALQESRESIWFLKDITFEGKPRKIITQNYNGYVASSFVVFHCQLTSQFRPCSFIAICELILSFVEFEVSHLVSFLCRQYPYSSRRHYDLTTRPQVRFIRAPCSTGWRVPPPGITGR